MLDDPERQVLGRSWPVAALRCGHIRWQLCAPMPVVRRGTRASQKQPFAPVTSQPESQYFYKFAWRKPILLAPPVKHEELSTRKCWNVRSLHFKAMGAADLLVLDFSNNYRAPQELAASFRGTRK